MVPLSKIWRLFRRYSAISLAADSEFRTDFFSSVLLQMLNAGMMVAFWDALIRAAGGLPGWSMGDLVLMTGLQVLSGVVGTLFFRMRQLPERVLKGELDRYLTRPAPALLCLQWERLYVRSMITETVSGLIIIGVAVFGWGFRPVPGGVLPAVLLLVLGTLIQTCLETTVAALSFWLGRVDSLQSIVGEAQRFSRFPVTFFDRPVRLLLTWIWPFGLCLTYPVLFMRGELDLLWPLLGGALGAVALWAFGLNRLLRAGVKRYESFGG
ncbi:MAG TPA: ABC-2 family transporter protein [Symbiobacteriaceae bacterium]|nr:ABC-2 family transporter protein [Symbiobacteriaceae bacterium]